MNQAHKGQWILLMDTCGDQSSLALMHGDEVAAETRLADRTASTELLAAVRSILAQGLAQGVVGVHQLAGVGVVSGPGSFTGLRVGLALAKGLCEAAGLPLAAVSRLAVLAGAAGLSEGFAVLRAGRDQVYVRELGGTAAPRESLLQMGRFAEQASGAEVAYTEVPLTAELEAVTTRLRLVDLTARDAFALVQSRLAEGAQDLALLDANYVRDEDAIYARAAKRA